MQTKPQEIRDRLGKIRPGEWSKYGISALINYGKKHCGMWDISERQDGETHVMPLCDEDADFIANTPTDIKFLLDALEQAQDRERVLRDAVNSLIGLCENVADFSNGNTYNEIDEGNVMAERFIDHIKSNIKALEDKPNANHR